MKEKIDDFLRLFVLWAWGLLGGGIIFPLRKVFGRIEMTGYEIRKSIFPEEGIIVIFNYPLPFLWEPVIFPSLLSIVNKRSYNGKFWFFPLILIERNEEKGWKSIRRFIQRVKESKVTILTSDSEKAFGSRKDNEVPKIRRFQSGVSILLKETQTTTIPILIEKEEKAIPNQSLLNDRLFFLSIWGKEKTSAP